MGHLQTAYKSVISLETSLTCTVESIQPCLKSREESINKVLICANVSWHSSRKTWVGQVTQGGIPMGQDKWKPDSGREEKTKGTVEQGFLRN